MSHEHPVFSRIESNHRWRFLGEIGIRDLDERPESVVSAIRPEYDGAHLRVNTEGIDRDVRAAVQAGFYLIDDLSVVDRWRPTPVNYVTGERIDGGKGSVDIKQAPDVFILDQADRPRYAQRDR